MTAEILLLAVGLVFAVVGAFAGLAFTVVGIGLVLLALAMQHGRIR